MSIQNLNPTTASQLALVLAPVQSTLKNLLDILMKIVSQIRICFQNQHLTSIFQLAMFSVRLCSELYDLFIWRGESGTTMEEHGATIRM
jgi:hypothetical protein